ncbi:MAG: PLP-dependent transferase [Chloroflexia bacterium]|nr:PLP-dependent transferase [Chloroflexia bacterium]
MELNGNQQDRNRRDIATRAVHTGERVPPSAARPTTTPIYLTSSFSYETTEQLDRVFGNEESGYVYSRYGNPTLRVLEHAVASLEQTEDAVAYPSGMAAIHAALALVVSAGDSVLAARDVYGATYAVLRDYFARFGVRTEYVDTLNVEAVAEAASRLQPAAILAETISNPLLRVTDLAAIGGIARECGATLIVDNTFASPVLVNPALLGADLVVHSSTKYLAGHGDTTGGIIACSAEKATVLREQSKLTGAVAGPLDAWLTLRGIKTLPLRIGRQSESAGCLVDWLQGDARVDRVHHPSLQPNLPTAQFTDVGYGGMVSFEIAGGDRDVVFRFLDALDLCVPATTLGDVYSLMLYPAISSHRALTAEQRSEIGIGEALVRLSVGIEAVADIRADLDQALGRALRS